MFCRSIFHIRRRGSSRPTAHGLGTSLCDKQYLLGSLGHYERSESCEENHALLHPRDMRVPHAPAPEQLERLKAEEKARAQELQRDGRWRHLWRVAGTLRASSTSRTMTNCTRFADNRVVVGEPASAHC